MTMTFLGKSRGLVLAAGVIAATLGARSAAAVEEITAVHAFPPFLVYTKSFLAVVDEINKRGEGVVKINVRGGPEAIGMFEQPKAVRDGVVDMVHIPGSFYGAAVPEIDAMVASNVTPAEARKNGGIAVMDAAHQKRMNVKYLGWIDGGIHFHIYMTKEPKFGPDGILDLTGVRLRDNPIYHAFFEALHATTASMAATEVYSAMEKGVVDAAAWTSIGIQDLKWDKFIKYRVDPEFYSTDLGIIMNLDRWNKLSDKAKKIVQDVVLEHEVSSYEGREADRKAQVADLQAKGIKFVSHSKEASAKYLKIANDSAWGRMKERLDKMGGVENYDKLMKTYMK